VKISEAALIAREANVTSLFGGMRFMLRHKQTGQYLKRAGLWVSRAEDAMTFEDMVDVREYCQAHRLDDVQPIRRLMPYLISLLRKGANGVLGNSGR
jgi:hypothetical protein